MVRWLRLSLRDHVRGSFNSNQGQSFIKLVKSSVMFSNVPWIPFSYCLNSHCFQIFLSVSVRHNIIPITIEKPYSDSTIQKYLSILFHRSLLADCVTDICAWRPSLADMINMEIEFIFIPIRNSTIVIRAFIEIFQLHWCRLTWKF